MSVVLWERESSGWLGCGDFRSRYIIDSTVIYSLEGGVKICVHDEWKNIRERFVFTGSMRENIASVKKRFP